MSLFAKFTRFCLYHHLNKGMLTVRRCYGLKFFEVLYRSGRLLTSASACTLHGYGMGMGKNLKKHSNHDLMTSKTTEFEKRIFPRMSSENHTLFTGANLVVRLASGLEVAKTRFQTFLLGNSVLFKWKCQIRELHAHGMERGQVLTRYCG